MTKTSPKAGEVNPSESSGPNHLPAALNYARQGLKIFPILEGTKDQPLIKQWGVNASSNPEMVKTWWTRWPQANIGLACGPSNIAVVDVDVKNGGKGRETIDDLEMIEGFPLTLTRQQRTPSGGLHHLYKGQLANAVGAIGPGVDTRGGAGSRNGGYILLPPSATIVGRYEWLNREKVAQVDQWVIDRCVIAERDGPVSQEPVVELDQAENIERATRWLNEGAPVCKQGAAGDDTLVKRIAAPLKDMAISEELACELLVSTGWNDRCEPPWQLGGEAKDNLYTKVHNGYVYCRDNPPGSGTAEAQFGTDPVEPEAVAEEVKAAEAKRRPRVLVVPARLPRMVREVQKHLIEDSKRPDAPTSDQIFQRGGDLVHLSRNKLKPRKPGEVVDRAFHVRDDLLIEAASDGWLTDRTMRAMDFYKVVDGRDGKDMMVLVPPPAKVVPTLRTITTSWQFPKLTATTETPTLRTDGSLLEQFGYDLRSGLYLDTGGIEFPKIKVRPTKTDAMAALSILERPLYDFPFRDDDGNTGLSKSVKLAAMLTACVRRSLPIAPTFGYDANEVASGKTMCAQVDAIMATGRRTGERPFTNDPTEQTKLLSAAFAAGDSVVLFDNVDVPIEGGPLCGVITDEVMTTRRLGGNSADDQIKAPTCSLILYTGNHLTAVGDMTRRVLVCKLVPRNALAARTFKFPSLDDYIIENRPTLVAAALTIMRAYIVAGRPTPGANCGFPAWRSMVADPLVWLGRPDPCLAFSRAAQEDPTRQNLAAVLRPWIADTTLNGWRPTAQLVSQPKVAQAVADACGIDLSKLTTRRAAEYLKNMVGVNVEGWRIERGGGSLKEAIVWRLAKAA